MRTSRERKPDRQLPFEQRVDGVRYGVLDSLIGYALRRAQLMIFEDFDTALASLDITPQRFAVLVAQWWNF